MSNQNINSNNAMSDEEYARQLQEQFWADGSQQSAQENNNGNNVHNKQNNIPTNKNGGISVKDFIEVCDKYKTSKEVNDYIHTDINMRSVIGNTKYSPRDVNCILEKVDIVKFKNIDDLFSIVDYPEKTVGSVSNNLSPKYIEFLFLKSQSYNGEEDDSNAEEHEKFCRWVCRFMIDYVKKISNGPNKPNIEFANSEIIETFFFDSESNKRKKSDITKLLGTDQNILKEVINNKLNVNFIIYLFQNNVGVGLEDDFLKTLMEKKGYKQEDIETIISKKNELWANSLTGSDLLQKDSYINKLLDGKIKSDKINFTDEEKTRLQTIKNIVLDINKILVETKLTSVKEYENTIDGLLNFNLNIHGNEDETKNFIQRAKLTLDLLTKSELIDAGASDIGEFLNHEHGNFAKIYNLAQSDFVKSYMVGTICELKFFLRFTMSDCFLNVFKSLKENTFADADNEEKQSELKKLFIKALIAKFKDKEIGSPWAKSFPIKDILEYKYKFDTEKSNEGGVFGQDSGLDQSDWEYFYCCCNEFGVDINKYWPNEANEKNVEYKNKYGNEMKLALEKNKKPANEIKNENSQIKEYEKKLIADFLTGNFDVQIEDANPEINNNVQPQEEVKDNKDNKDNEENNVNNLENNNPNTEVKKDKDNVDVKENQNENKEQIPEVANNDYGLPDDIFKDIDDCVNKMAFNEINTHDNFITELNRIASKAQNDDTRQKAKNCFIDIFFQNQKCIEKIAAYDKELFVVKMMGKLFKDHEIDLSNVNDYLNANSAYNGFINRGQGQGEDAKGILKQKERLFVDIKEQLEENAKQKNDLFIDENDINYFETVWDEAVQKYNEQNKSEENVEQEDSVHEENSNQNIANPEQNENKPVEEKNDQELAYNIKNNINDTIKEIKELGNEDLPGAVIDELNKLVANLKRIKVKDEVVLEAKSYFMDKFFSDCIEKVSQFGDGNLFVALMISHILVELDAASSDCQNYLEAHKKFAELKKQPNNQGQKDLEEASQDMLQKFKRMLEFFEEVTTWEQNQELLHINKTDIENFIIKWDKSIKEYNEKSPEDKKLANLFSDGMTEEELKAALANMNSQSNISDNNNKANQLNKNNEENEEDEVDVLKEEAIAMLMSEAYKLTVENIKGIDSDIKNLKDSYLPISFLSKLINCNEISQNAIHYFIDKLFFDFGDLLKEQYLDKMDVFKFDIATALIKIYSVEIPAIINYEQTISEKSIEDHLLRAATRAVQNDRRFNEQDRDNEKNNFISQARQNALRSIILSNIKDQNGKAYVSEETMSYFEAKFSELSKGKQNKYGDILQNEEAINKKKEELRQKKIQELKNKIKQESESQKPEKKEELNHKEIIKQQLKLLSKKDINNDELDQIANSANNKKKKELADATKNSNKNNNSESQHDFIWGDSNEQLANQNAPLFLADRKKTYENQNNNNIENKQNGVVQSQQVPSLNTEKKDVETNPIINVINPEINNNLLEQKQENNNNPEEQDNQAKIQSNSQVDNEQKSGSNFKLYSIISVTALVILLILTFTIPLPSIGKVIFTVFDSVAFGSTVYNGVQALRLYFKGRNGASTQLVIGVNSSKSNDKDQISNGEQTNENVPVTDNNEKGNKIEGQEQANI